MKSLAPVMSAFVLSILSVCPQIRCLMSLICMVLLGWSATTQAQTIALKSLYDIGATEAPIRGALVEAGDGNFYGTTYGEDFYQSGHKPGSWGTIFKLSPGDVETTLYLFSGGDDGANPNGLTLGKDGSFYGTTFYGGSSGVGTIFRITPTGQFATLYTFANSTNPSPHPAAPLIRDAQGNLYGTTRGSTNRNSDDGQKGSIFRVTPKGEFTTLHNFNGQDGYYPAAALLLGSDGNFYGTTAGTIFRMTPEGDVTTLAALPSGGGEYPSSLIEGADGNFYGVNPSDPGDLGGVNVGLGTVFKITPQGAMTTLHTFIGDDGLFPSASLLLGTDGNLYGTTLDGGSTSGRFTGQGTLFQLSPSGTFAVLYTFRDAVVGTNPTAALIQGSDGMLYGATSSAVYSVDLGLPAPPPTLTATITGVSSINGAGGKAVVLIKRTGDTSAPLTAHYILRGTAQNGVDYRALSGLVTFPAGSAKAKVKILPLPQVAQAGEIKTVTVKLKSASDGSYKVGAPAKVSVQIVASGN